MVDQRLRARCANELVLLLMGGTIAAAVITAYYSRCVLIVLLEKSTLHALIGTMFRCALTTYHMCSSVDRVVRCSTA